VYIKKNIVFCLNKIIYNKKIKLNEKEIPTFIIVFNRFYVFVANKYFLNKYSIVYILVFIKKI